MAYLVDIYKESDRHKHFLIASDVPPDAVDLAMKMFMAGMYCPAYWTIHRPTVNEFVHIITHEHWMLNDINNFGEGWRETVRVVHTHGCYPECRFILVHHKNTAHSEYFERSSKQ